MLELLHLKNVGPSDELQIEFGDRLNFVTGDNGLGKTFLLDIAWWSLTRTWAHSRIMPHRKTGTKPSMKYSYTTSNGRAQTFTSEFDRKNQSWPHGRSSLRLPGMVIYAQVDGGFSIWDPARNYPKKKLPDTPERPRSFSFSSEEVWNGLPLDSSKKLCNGLIHDWAAWQRDNGEAFDQLIRVLEKLSPSIGEPLVPGKLTRVSLDDVRDHPILKMPYQQEVALIHSSQPWIAESMIYLFVLLRLES